MWGSNSSSAALTATSLPPTTAEPTPTTAPAPTLRAPTLTPDRSLRGTILIEGSSTVFPIAEIAVREFQAMVSDVQIPLGVSGTGGGFKKFCTGETAISNASRPINAAESAMCRENGITFVEAPIAFDGISVVVNPANTWARCMTVAELRMLWEPAAEGRILRWSQIRPDWPDADLTLYGAGEDSGTYDYFTSAVVGEEGVSRRDFTGSEDDYILAQGVARNPNGPGFFGYAYYSEFTESTQDRGN
jgi:phosphate transport system substrate-binding protein